MCGIAGGVFASITENAILLVKKSMHNRGPDGSGHYLSSNAALIHTRLSVIDLSLQATQPMVSVCGRYHIVFNGEIYNYQELRNRLLDKYSFSSNSDTEVILAYFVQFGGPKTLELLRGMFAFAIWDNVKKELFLARDRLGVKPLYFSSNNKSFFFASRPKALHILLQESKITLCRQAVRYYLEAGYIPAPYSIYKGVHKLEPGHYLTVSEKGVKKTRYWSPDSIEIDNNLTKSNLNVLLDELDELIDESIRMRMVSDVPLGAFLSGGIDSSLVTAYMGKYTKDPVKTFTIGFENNLYDESNYAQAVADQLGTEHTCQQLAADDLLELMPTFMLNYDEPFFDYSSFPVMAVSRLASKSVTVVLSGDGGDEAFGGYHYYQIMQNLHYAHILPKKIRNMIGNSFLMTPSQKLRWLGRLIALDGQIEAYAFMRGIIKDAEYLMSPSLLEETRPLSYLFKKRAETFPPDLTYPETGMRIDLAYTLPDDYLQKVDLGSMAFSIEARDPLLDHKIIEWSSKLPLNWKLRNGTNKYLLRQLAYRYIPRQIIDRPKMGFGVPMAQWLRGGLKKWGESLLEDDKTMKALELNVQGVRSLWIAHQREKLNANTALWSVLVLIQFYKNQVEQ